MNRYQPTLCNILIDRTKDGIFVFHRDGKPFGAVKTAFNNALRRSRIGYCRFHDLRHTFATKLVLSGLSLPVVKELLGHASTETTMRYAHPTPESKKQAVNMLNWQKVDSDRHYLDTRIISADDTLALIGSK
jgi:integrase